jgi:hypothetical protein
MAAQHGRLLARPHPLPTGDAMEPIWIDGWYESQAEAVSDMREGLDDALGRYVYPVQALTLDQIEAWLAQEYELSQVNGERGYMSCMDLLAQVQAWREQK